MAVVKITAKDKETLKTIAADVKTRVGLLYTWMAISAVAGAVSVVSTLDAILAVGAAILGYFLYARVQGLRPLGNISVMAVVLIVTQGFVYLAPHTALPISLVRPIALISAGVFAGAMLARLVAEGLLNGLFFTPEPQGTPITSKRFFELYLIAIATFAVGALVTIILATLLISS